MAATGGLGGRVSAAGVSAAQWLRAAAGLQRGEYCAMLAHNSTGYLAISLGAMSLGAISLNLNWRMPDATTKILLEDLKAKVLVASKPFRATATAMHQKLGIKMVLIESICSEQGAPFEPPQPDHAASLSAEIASEVRCRGVAKGVRVCACADGGGLRGACLLGGSAAIPHPVRCVAP